MLCHVAAIKHVDEGATSRVLCHGFYPRQMKVMCRERWRRYHRHQTLQKTVPSSENTNKGKYIAFIKQALLNSDMRLQCAAVSPVCVYIQTTNQKYSNMQLNYCEAKSLWGRRGGEGEKGVQKEEKEQAGYSWILNCLYTKSSKTRCKVNLYNVCVK